MKKRTLVEINKIAKKKGGKCISKEYKNNKFSLSFVCSKGHFFNLEPSSLFYRNSWCKQCYLNEIRSGLKECINVAKVRGGQCLSKKYINQNYKMKWKCKNNHCWIADYRSIKRGDWCKKCYYNTMKLSLKDCFRLAKKLNFKCLSKKYNNSNTPLTWKCLKCKHKWKAPYHTIKQAKEGFGCPSCFEKRNRKGNDLIKCKELATQNGGICISKEYKNNHQKMEWQCKLGHIWQTSLKQIKKGRWCHECAARKRKCKGQEITRNFIEVFFNKPFKSKYPDWLINPETNRKLEIDGFNEELGVGFEYQGFQHYKYHSFIHKNKENFLKIKKRDQLKKKIFKNRGLILLIIKEFNTNKNKEWIKKYLNNVITKQLEFHKYSKKY